MIRNYSNYPHVFLINSKSLPKLTKARPLRQYVPNHNLKDVLLRDYIASVADSNDGATDEQVMDIILNHYPKLTSLYNGVIDGDIAGHLLMDPNDDVVGYYGVVLTQTRLDLDTDELVQLYPMLQDTVDWEDMDMEMVGGLELTELGLIGESLSTDDLVDIVIDAMIDFNRMVGARFVGYELRTTEDLIPTDVLVTHGFIALKTDDSEVLNAPHYLLDLSRFEG